MSTWEPVDLEPILAGEETDAPPSLLRRTDGHALLYAGKVHSIAGPAESLKSWVALVAAVEPLCVGEHVAFLDFEDSPAAIVHRLLAMGVPGDHIAKSFHYLRPDSPFDAHARADLARLVERYPPVLAVVDGVTEAMSLLGLDLMKNADAAVFSAELLRPMALTGAAVLSLDHLPKDADARTRTAIGAGHKLAMIDGAAYIADVTEPFGRGRTGKVTLHVAKDRPGFVREHARQGRVAAVLTLTSETDGAVRTSLELPSDTTSSDWRPTVLMTRVAEVLGTNPKGLSGNQIETVVRGKATTIRAALQFLVADGYVSVENQGAAKKYRSAKPYLPPA